MIDARNEFRQTSKDNFREISKRRLIKIINRKFLTAIINSLSEFENVFGKEVWGLGLPNSGLSDSQRANRARWERTRTNILNKGHAQARGVKMELDLHDIEFIGYLLDFKLGDNNAK